MKKRNADPGTRRARARRRTRARFQSRPRIAFRCRRAFARVTQIADEVAAHAPAPGRLDHRRPLAGRLLRPRLFFGKRAGKNTSDSSSPDARFRWWLPAVDGRHDLLERHPEPGHGHRAPDGVAGNWVGGLRADRMATVFFYAQLWRRSGVMTISSSTSSLLRQGGQLRARASLVYLGLFFNCMIMATVNLAACKIAASCSACRAGRRCSGRAAQRPFATHSASGAARHRHDPVLHQDDAVIAGRTSRESPEWRPERHGGQAVQARGPGGLTT